MAGYIDFINSMLNLRSQRLQEERYKQLAREEQQKQMMSMIGNISEGISKFGQQYGQNQMANRMMNEYFPQPLRAEAVKRAPETVEYAPGIGPIRSGGGYVPDLAMQKRADIAAQGMPGFYQGGMPELKMRMEMEGLRDKRTDFARKLRGDERAEDYLALAKEKAGEASERATERSQNAAINLDLRRQAAARADETARVRAEQKLVDDAYRDFHAASPKFKEQAKNAEAYHSNIRATLEGMTKPYTSQETYLQGLSKIDSLYAAAESQGLKVERPKVASWEDMEAARQKQLAIDAAARGDWNPFTDDAARAAALQKELQGMPGYLQNPMRVDPQSYLARPSMEEPVPPNPEEIRARARLVPAPGAATPAQGASAAAPKIRTVSVQEGTSIIGKPVRSGQRFTDPTTGEVIIIQ